MSYEYSGRDPAQEIQRLAQIVQCYERATNLTYGTTVRVDGSVSRAQMITATNGVAFTVANPTLPRENAVIALDFYNNSGGVLGAVTFGTDYELPTTFTAPANGSHLVYVFYRSNDKKWREYGRTGAVQTSDLANDAVTYAKMQNVSASPRLIGRTTAGAGDPEEISVAATLNLAALVLDIANQGVTYAKIQNVSASPRLLGRTTAGAGVIEELTAGPGLALAGGVLDVNSFFKRKTGAQTTAITTLADCTDLTFALGSGKDYRFKFGLVYQCPATTTFPKVAVNGPAITYISYNVTIGGQAADGVSAFFHGVGTALDDAVTSSALVAANTNYLVEIEGVIRTAGAGNLAARIASSVAANCVWQIGSYGFLWPLN